MKYINTYEKLGLNNKDEEVFNYLLENLTDSIFTWDYFVDFQKVIENVNKFEKELNLLNVLIGKENIEEKFIELIREYPKVRGVLSLLIAVRKAKLKELKIITDIEDLISEYKKNLFDYKVELNNEIEKELLIFFNESGLKDILQNKNVKNLVDYCFGIEVGMDTNARKNRTGTSMEKLIEKLLNVFSKKYDLEYISQATKRKIKEKWDYDIETDRTARRFDFAVFNKNNEKLYIIEVNYYSGGGSKVKSTAAEYKTTQDLLKPQGIDLIWITDGLGWKSTKAGLYETFLHNDFVFNIDLIKKGILKDVIL